MTKREIKEAIAKGIAGQGTNVDGGGYLPKILEAIVDAIPESGAIAPEPTITVRADANFDGVDESEAATNLNITLDELKALPNQQVIGTSDGLRLTRIYYAEVGGYHSVIFGGKDIGENTGLSLYLSNEGGSYTFYKGVA